MKFYYKWCDIEVIMKVWTFLVIGTCTVFASQAVDPELLISIDYHNDIGIPEAARIKAFEERVESNLSRIVGGSTSSLGQYPYQAGLVISLTSGTSVCGASLLSNTRLVTAAHCWRTTGLQAYEFEVVLGSVTLFKGGVRRLTTEVTVHSDYNPRNLNNDIAIIVISSVSYSNNIQPIALPSGSWVSSNFVYSNVVASGFGKTSDSTEISNKQVLSHVTLQVIPNQECADTYGDIIVTPSTICTSNARNQGTCGGDSGGPVVFTNGPIRILVGIVSFGHAAGCETRYPSGHIRVTSFIPWIQARL